MDVSAHLVELQGCAPVLRVTETIQIHSPPLQAAISRCYTRYLLNQHRLPSLLIMTTRNKNCEEDKRFYQFIFSLIAGSRLGHRQPQPVYRSLCGVTKHMYRVTVLSSGQSPGMYCVQLTMCYITSHNITKHNITSSFTSRLSMYM